MTKTTQTFLMLFFLCASGMECTNSLSDHVYMYTMFQLLMGVFKYSSNVATPLNASPQFWCKFKGIKLSLLGKTCHKAQMFYKYEEKELFPVLCERDGHKFNGEKHWNGDLFKAVALLGRVNRWGGTENSESFPVQRKERESHQQFLPLQHYIFFNGSVQTPTCVLWLGSRWYRVSSIQEYDWGLSGTEGIGGSSATPIFVCMATWSVLLNVLLATRELLALIWVPLKTVLSSYKLHYVFLDMLSRTRDQNTCFLFFFFTISLSSVRVCHMSAVLVLTHKEIYSSEMPMFLMRLEVWLLPSDYFFLWKSSLGKY